MDAILYAAGRGNRLGESANEPHKLLLRFAGQSLLERHLIQLAIIGVRQLFVVTGHERQALANEFKALQQKHGVLIEELFNPNFLEGSALSMHVSLPALRQAQDRVLLMDGDVLYGRGMLRRLLASTERTALLIDQNYPKDDEDPVLVPLREGRPFDFTKRWRGTADLIGESVGFFKVDRLDLPELIRETEARQFGAGRNESYDDILRVLVKAGRFGAEDITGQPWTEIDFPHDLVHAREVILPAIQQLESSEVSPLGGNMPHH